MVEVKMNPFSVGIPSNGYTSQLLFERINFQAHCQCFTCRPCVYVFRQGRRSMKIKGCYTFLEVTEMREKKMSMICKSVMNADKDATPYKIASTEYKNLGDNKSVSILEEKEGDCEFCNEEKVPCLDSSMNGRDIMICEDGKGFQPSLNKVGDDRLFYLEERNEEELSKRILKLSRLNKVRSVLKLFRSMEIAGLQPSVHACNSLLSCLLRNGMVDDALRIFYFMDSRNMATGQSCSLILKGVANSLGCDAALVMFEELEKNSHVSRSFDAIVYNTMISIVSKEKKWIHAEKIWRRLQERAYPGTTVTYSLLVCTFVRCNQYELAFDAYHEMKQNDIMPSEDVMHAVIGACSKEGKWDLGLSVFERMLDVDGLKPNMIACNALINTLGKAGKVKLAFKIYNVMKSLGHEPDAYTWNALLGALNRANRHADALQFFDDIRREQRSVVNLQIYNTVLVSCKKLGLWEKALQLLWEMEVSGLCLSVAHYNLVIGACEAARQPKVGLQIYDHMIHQKHSPDIFTLLPLIRSCIWSSLWTEMEEILNRYPPNASMYNTAIQGLCLREKINLAMKLYEKMNEWNLKPDGKTRALILQKLHTRKM